MLHEGEKEMFQNERFQIERFQIGMYLKKIHLSLERGRNRILKKYDLTAPQIDTLVYLLMHEDSENTLTAIAAYFGVKHTSTIHVLKLLEKKGFIYREEMGSRTKQIFLTEKARSVLAEDKRALEHVYGMMLDGLTPEEQSQLECYLQRLYENLKHGFSL